MAIGSWARRMYSRFGETLGGTQAVTVQNFVELNIKAGVQFFFREKFNNLAAGNQKHYYIVTGDKPVIVKDRSIKTNSNEIYYNLYSSPTITNNGTPRTISNYNLISPSSTTFQIYEAPTFSDKGNLSALSDWFPGDPGGGFAGSTGVYDTEGTEVIVPPNSAFLVEFDNQGSASADIQYHLSWYEGNIQEI